jgi:beta-mannosidase
VSGRLTQDLCGTWRLSALHGSAASGPVAAGAGVSDVPAEVPGCVHLDLERAGLVPPLARDGDGPHVDWIGRTAWRYTRTFELASRLAHADDLELVCEGLQGLARVVLDGREIGRADNQFRTFRFRVGTLAPGVHELAIEFDDAMAFLAAKERERPLPAWGVGQDKDSSGAWLRASPVMFGWDFAPRAVTAGIWRTLRLESSGTARIDHLGVHQTHRTDGSVVVGVEAWLAGRVAARGSEARVSVDAVLSLAGAVVAHAAVDVAATREACDGATRRADASGAHGLLGAPRLALLVANPRLWWPNGEGDQPLYDLLVEVRGADGALLDRATRRLGLRTLVLVRERQEGPNGTEESFLFRVNGRDVCIRGANWVPPQLHDAGEDRGHVTRLVDLARRAHFCMLRVWGGGPYASEAFYDACDAAGILVWQDLPFACCTYPTFDDAFLANVELELVDQCRRLHHRASLALWCGNNELENGLVEEEWTERRMAWRDYARLFDELAPRVVAAESHGTAWWPGSPHSPLHDRMAFNDERSGDAHLWEVWHAEAPFERFLDYRHRFASEFGFQSPPDPVRLVDFVGPDVSTSNPRVQHRQRSANGDARIDRYLAREDLDPSRLRPEARAHLVRLLQARGMGLAMEHERRMWPRCGGFLLWQFDEPWLAPSWSIVDADGRAKPAYEATRRASRARLLSLWHAPASGRVQAAFTDHAPAAAGTLTWRLAVHALDAPAHASALAVHTGRVETRRGTQSLFDLDLAEVCAAAGRAASGVLLELDAVDGRGRLERTWLAPARLGQVATVDPRLVVVDVVPLALDDGRSASFRVDVRAWHHALHPLVLHPRLALVCRQHLSVVRAGTVARLHVEAREPVAPADLASGLEVTSLHGLVLGARAST